METAIIGAGVSGLALAGFLQHDANTTLLEASDSLGGLVRSERMSEVLYQWGANGFLDDEPAVQDLIDALHLEPLKAKGGSRYLLHKGTPTALPKKPPALIGSPLLGFWAKLRLLCEPMRRVKTEEQSVYDYLCHRIGRGATDAFSDPFVSGIWAGDPKNLSMQAAFPRLVAQVETHGSLFRAMKHRKKSGKPTPVLTSFKGGLSEIGHALQQQFKGQIQTGCAVSALERDSSGWLLQTPQGAVSCQRVILALNASHSAKLLMPLAPKAAQLLDQIPHASVAVVHTIFSREGWSPPEGFGILCPHREQSNSLGVLFTSSIFPTHCPPDVVVMRSILGGTLHPTLAARDPQEIQQLALDDLKRFLPDCPTPISQHCIVHSGGIPQYTLGHRERIQAVRQEIATLPKLHLVGNYLEGVAVKDCIRVAQDCAREIATSQ